MNRAYYEGLEIEALRTICATELEPGEIWRPCVVAEYHEDASYHRKPGLKTAGWYWHDTRDGAPRHHGPHRDERGALIEAIFVEGHQRGCELHPDYSKTPHVPDNPVIALVSVQAADEVARFLQDMIPDHAQPDRVKAWEEVRDALYAIANDTDVIMTREEE